MNTLHMYHWQNAETLQSNLPLMGGGDSLLIYGSLSTDEIKTIVEIMSHHDIPWFLVNSSGAPIMSDREIDSAQWLELIINHNNTWAWK